MLVAPLFDLVFRVLEVEEDCFAGFLVIEFASSFPLPEVVVSCHVGREIGLHWHEVGEIGSVVKFCGGLPGAFTFRIKRAS